MFDHHHFDDLDRHANPFERRGRLFKKGDMKYVILDLLKDKPSHGYELTMALENRFQGFYSPSAGTVYPVLQLLEDMGYVTSASYEGKKVYTITDSGKKFLEDQKETTDKIGERVRGWWGSDKKELVEALRESMGNVRDLHFIIGRLASRKDLVKLNRINELLQKAKNEIREIYED